MKLEAPGILEPIEYVPISYTFIVYEKDSLLSKAMAYSSLIPIFLVVAYAAVILAR